jgi:D-allulose-6-phosphate 3-epimerase
MNKNLYKPLYEAGADVVVMGPPALWNKDSDFKKAWTIMEDELQQELWNAERNYQNS